MKSRSSSRTNIKTEEKKRAGRSNGRRRRRRRVGGWPSTPTGGGVVVAEWGAAKKKLFFPRRVAVSRFFRDNFHPQNAHETDEFYRNHTHGPLNLRHNLKLHTFKHNFAQNNPILGRRRGEIYHPHSGSALKLASSFFFFFHASLCACDAGQFCTRSLRMTHF